MGNSNLSAGCSSSTILYVHLYIFFHAFHDGLSYPLSPAPAPAFSSPSSYVSKSVSVIIQPSIDLFAHLSFHFRRGPSYSHSSSTTTTATTADDGFHYGTTSGAASTTPRRTSVPFAFPAYTAAPATAVASESLGSHTPQIQARNEMAAQSNSTNHFHFRTLSLNSSSSADQTHFQPHHHPHALHPHSQAPQPSQSQPQDEGVITTTATSTTTSTSASASNSTTPQT